MPPQGIGDDPEAVEDGAGGDREDDQDRGADIGDTIEGLLARPFRVE